jgi:drug/metabolite transporter (DMT)-like permease
VSGASQTRAYLALLAIVALWGSFPATTKLALVDFPPFFLAAVRCAVAACFLLVLLARSPSDTIRGLGPDAVKTFLILGAAGIWGSMQFTYLAIYYTTAANAVMLQAATPITVALIARLYLGERLRRAQWLGVAASGLGVLLVITRGRLTGITLASLCSWAVYTVFGKRVLASHSPLLATTAAYCLGTLLILPTAVLTAPLFPTPRLGSLTAWAVVFFQGLLGAVAHIWWYEAVHVVGPARPLSSRTFSRSWGSCWPPCSWGSASRSGRSSARCWCWRASPSPHARHSPGAELPSRAF